MFGTNNNEALLIANPPVFGAKFIAPQMAHLRLLKYLLSTPSLVLLGAALTTLAAP